MLNTNSRQFKTRACNFSKRIEYKLKKRKLHCCDEFDFAFASASSIAVCLRLVCFETVVRILCFVYCLTASRNSRINMSGRGRLSRHPLPDEMHGYYEPPMHHRRGPPPPHHIEEELAAGHDKIRRLIADNRFLVEENIAMKRELDVNREELYALEQVIPKVRAEKEAKTRELIQMGLKLEAELRELEPLKAEAMELKAEARKLEGLKQEMNAEIQNISKDLKGLQAENKHIPKMRMEIDSLRQELVRFRKAYDYEQKARAEQMEQRQAMEKNLVSMSREIEKLKTENARLENRTRGAGAGAYSAEMSYANSYSDSFGHEQGIYGAGGAGARRSYGMHGFPRP